MIERVNEIITKVRNISKQIHAITSYISSLGNWIADLPYLEMDKQSEANSKPVHNTKPIQEVSEVD